MKTKNKQRIHFSLIVLLLFALSPGVYADTMKIAVPAMAKSKDALISKETGRAPIFLFFDANGHFIEAMENPAKDQQGGVSRSVITLLVAKGVTLIIVEDIGDKMKQALDDHHIRYVTNKGAADNAVQAFIATL